MSAPAIQAKWEGLEGIGAGRDALNTHKSHGKHAQECCSRVMFGFSKCS